MTSLDLTICSVNFNSWQFLYFLDYTIRTLSTRLRHKWIVCDVTPTESQVDHLSRLPDAQILHCDLNGLKGSEAHGTALNQIVPMVDTEFGLIIDPDCAMLARGWDETCAGILHGDCVAVGAPYHPSAWFRYQALPHVVFTFFRTEPFRRLAIDFRPEPHWLRRAKAVVTQRLCLARLEDRDTGWRMPRAFREAGYSACAFSCLKRNDAGSIVLAPDGPGQEYLWEGRPIATHQKEGGSREFNRDPVSRVWLDKVCAHLGLARDEIDAIGCGGVVRAK